MIGEGNIYKVTPMAQWTILLFFLYGVLHGQEIQPPTVQECCQDGRNRALRGQDCTILPLISHSHTCRITQEQCCAAAVGDRLCDNGVKMAKGQGACETPFFQGDPWETRISKMCCDCCMLGLMTPSQDSSCELQGLLLGRQCALTAKTCCGKDTTEENKPTASAPVTERPEANVTETATLPDGLDPCRDSNCSQLCEGNGTCVCLGGYHLQRDGVTCEDVNECLTGSHNCVIGQVCINTEGSFRCQREISCGTGYELKDDNNCQDIDECMLGTHNCGPEFLCTNTKGSFRCHPKERCSDGFMQDAMGSCSDINECLAHTSPCLPGQTCINTPGSYTCHRYTVTCGRGYHLTEDGRRCEDVDECRTGTMCGDHGCVNLVGTYRCDCRTGYIFNSITKLCEDINECRLYSGRLCAHKCDNTKGSYQCGCTTGFQLSPDGRNCGDINECEANPCSQECANVYGSYQCYCRRGYQLSDIDGITCEDIDECALPTGGHVCSYRCSNAPGSFYCTCPPVGYTLAHNGRTCQDIDECAAGTHTCSISENCFNIQGGFRCLSYACPENYRQTAQGRCERVTCEFTRDPASCFLLPLRISFYNISFPTNTPVPTDVFRMGPANSVLGDQMLLNIVSGDEEGYFVVQQHAHGGEISLSRTLSEPRDFFLTVEMRLIRYGTAHLYMAKIAVFVTHELPIRPSRTFPY
ncbi:fibulin-1-like isoform X2 [Sebastes umbrosus]|uniref:fibulin-1-like isoform X2 n=1 Tax=Sebastes umbrosus TaxID=72105 RepID=UPI00189F0B08|nr:fibulin-1-like isoform X2 [Sebastes umbrosus]